MKEDKIKDRPGRRVWTLLKIGGRYILGSKGNTKKDVSGEGGQKAKSGEAIGLKDSKVKKIGEVG